MNKHMRYLTEQANKAHTFSKVEKQLSSALQNIEVTPKEPSKELDLSKLPTGTKRIEKQLSSLDVAHLKQVITVAKALLEDKEAIEATERAQRAIRLRVLNIQNTLKDMIVECYLGDSSIKDIASSVGTTQKAIRAILKVDGAL